MSAARRKDSAIRFWLPSGSLTQSLGLDPLLVAFGILDPIAGAGRGVNPHDAVGPGAQLAQSFRDAATLADLREKVGTLGLVPHGGPAAGRRPNGSDDRADDQILGSDLVGELL